MIFREDWCCKASEIWDDQGEIPPCHVCPMEGFEILPKNLFCFQRWSQLCLTGRDVHMGGMGGLREEAISRMLSRYDADTPDIYEIVMTIENGMYDHLKEQEKKSQEQRRLEKANQPKNLQQARARQAPGQSTTYRSVPQRPTMKMPKKG